MYIYWELDLEEARSAKRVETLIRKNDDGSYTILGTARTQKQYNKLSKQYFNIEQGKIKI